MNIQEIKDIVAQKLGYVGWHEIIDDHKLSDEIVDLLLTEQFNKHGVSGKRPMLTEIQIVQAMAAVDEARQKLEALLAACDSGAVDKTVSDGNALQKFLKEEKEIEKRDGKIFDE